MTRIEKIPNKHFLNEWLTAREGFSSQDEFLVTTQGTECYIKFLGVYNKQEKDSLYGSF